MTLYSFPFSCSFAVELELRRLQLPVEVHNVRRGQARKVADALPNPRRKVPTLVVDGASRTEIVSILHELDCGHVQRPAPQRRAHLEWLSFLATELHQQVIGPWFDADTPEVARLDARDRLLPPVLADLEAALTGPTLLPEGSSSADAYLLWCALLLGRIDRSLVGPALGRFRDAQLLHPWVQETIARHRRDRAATP